MDAYTKSRIAMLIIFALFVIGITIPLTKAMDAVLQSNAKQIEMMEESK